jgi:3'(2'), 5'-bisphosphate nucleotidase
MWKPDHEATILLGIARRAADAVMAVYGTAFAVELKGPNDPVTRADREANELICRELAQHFPGDAVVAEESAPDSPEATLALVSRERVFFVDPVDGTREFTERNGEFAVMIGLAVRGRAELGVVLHPPSGDAMIGRVGHGAVLEARDGSRRPLRVSDVDDPAHARLVVSRSHRPKLITPFKAALGISQELPCGSVGLKVARIATAAAEVYAHGGVGAKRWDSCGPEAVLIGAGGRFTDLSGAPIDYASADLVLRTGILATNAALQPAALAAALVATLEAG